MAGDDGILKKDEFIKIIRGSNLFIKTFDKNQDGIVSEVGSRLIRVCCLKAFIRLLLSQV